MIDKYFSTHNHTHYSNLRLIDCINKPIDLINYAIKIGLTGLVITDHESLSAAMEVNQYAKKLRETNPDFVIGLGNEIYLTDNRETNQKYYHFILIAKDELGFRALKELSSTAWYNMYSDRGLERVPTLKSELKEVLSRYKGHVIGTNACIGGELASNALLMVKAQMENNREVAVYHYNQIKSFLNFVNEVFGDDFYLEVAAANNEEQIIVNKKIAGIAKAYGLKMIFATDSHYLRKEDRPIHKAFLNSKDGEREVDNFYEFAYMMKPEEAYDILKCSFDDDVIEGMVKNLEEIRSKISFYSLEHHQQIPEVEVKDYPKGNLYNINYTVLNELFNSDNIQERYWVNQCIEALINKGIGLDKKYLDRLEEEARIKKIIGEKLQTCMFAYPNTLQHYIDLFWNCGSTVGAGRGSACSGLNHYLLGITQLDPIKWDLPFWRYLNEERVELGDIDLDLAPSKLPAIFDAIRKERGELGIIQVATFGTETSKAAIQTACRGYRSEEWPNGIDIDEAQYLSSLVPVERGFSWSIEEMVNGNPEKGRLPVALFVNELHNYPGLLNIILGIEGLITRRGSHASGVIFYGDDIYDHSAIMKAPSGALTTQWDLHKEEAAGNVKYDFLLTSVQDIIIQTVKLLQADGIIEKDLSLREVYDKYLHPNVLPIEDKRIWDALAEGSVIDCFQFDSAIGAQAAKKIKPKTPLEMADANGLMRLMTSDKGEETPLDKYVRFKEDLSQWYKEMDSAGLSKAEETALEPYFKSSYGVPPSQEQLMRMLMDENICGFTLAEANAARKIVGKKQMDKIPALHAKVVAQAKSPHLGAYVWKNGVGPQMGYSFSVIHALAYSFVGIQTLYLATHFNPIYWDTACLIVDSGSLDENSDSTDYKKLATAIGKMRKAGIEISLVDINHSQFGFIPDVENNRILFGMKAMLNVGDDLVSKIIELRPYTSVDDFLERVKPTKTAMISLIKGGAFDQFENREDCMNRYIWSVCDKKQRLTLQNLPALMNYGMVPNSLKTQKSIYEFNRYLKAMCKYNAESYKLDDRAFNFLVKLGIDDIVDIEENHIILNIKTWERYYESTKDVFRNWINANKDRMLAVLNMKIFNEMWQKYASGTVSAWEMEVLCFYYHEHELAHTDMEKYGIKDFFSLPEEPVIERTYTTRNGHTGNIFKLNKICGTCIAKNKLRHSVSVLTTTGVVEVKFNKEYFSLFDKQISAKDSDGVKHVLEKSWFNRGSIIMVQGFRSGDNFIPKKYGSNSGHQLYKVTAINPDGTLEFQGERYQGTYEDE